MAVDQLSPRISFSFNLCDLDAAQKAVHSPPSNTAHNSLQALDYDFEFCLSESFEPESSSADELFSDGRILAVPVKEKNVPERRSNRDCLPPSLPSPKESISCNPRRHANTASPDPEAICDGKMPHDRNIKDARSRGGPADNKPSRSFWGFRRSSSWGSANSHGTRLCFLPLMPRSNSTGSSSPETKQHRQRYPPPQCWATKNNQKASSSKCLGSHHHQRGALQVSPVVLNVPTGDMFGLSLLFPSRKTKNNHV
ncbi:hypothetical protein BT93_J0978 [Corymbia citriodora subsp. variegata]|nr:hypothetical protein BT93_J0978 [Corymbia citriodora subsp. variegata]